MGVLSENTNSWLGPRNFLSLDSERATNGQFGLSSGGFAQDGVAAKGKTKKRMNNQKFAKN